MVGYSFNLKLLTLQPSNVSEKNICIHQYYNKNANIDGEYNDIKKNFVLNRGGMWIPRNKRPDKLRDAIKMFEEVLKLQEVICLDWKSDSLLQIIFNSGLIAIIELSSNNDVVKLSFDKLFVGKISDGAFSGLHGNQFVCFAFTNQTKLLFSTLKPEYKMYNVDIPGPQSKIHRNLCLNSTQELMVCWWQFGPWLQTAREHERVNVVLLRCSFGRLEVLRSIETENDLIAVEFSKAYPDRILTLEKSYNAQKEKYLDTVIYECANNDIQRLNIISLPVKGGILSHSRNSSEDKLVIGCSDGSLTVYDLTIQKPLATLERSSLVPSIVRWLDPLILVGSGQGELRFYDSVLNSLSFYDMEEKSSSSLQLSDLVTSGNSLIKMDTSTSNISLMFNGGPVAVLNFVGHPSTTDLIAQHVYCDKITEAVNLLASINWNYETDDAYRGLLFIADWILQQPLNHNREMQLEATFAAFYASKHPIGDPIIVKYRSTIGCYARRFFHHLLRYQRFEKALLLAKDINSSDLFLDIYFAAKDLGEMQLAKVAKLKADEIVASESSDEEERWKSLALQQISSLAPNNQSKDHLEDALQSEFAARGNTGSPLKVTNLGYV